MNKQKVSVIVPAYNCGKYIKEAIECVLEQTYENKEILVVDDGSTDNTQQIVRQYVERSEVKYFYQKNKGPAASRNTGIRNATGEYVSFLDADDLWDRAKLQKSIEFIENNGFDWICTGMIKVKQNGEKLIKRIPETSWVIDPHTKEIKQLKRGIFYFSSVPVHTPTITARMECFRQAGLFDESFLVGEDTDLWLRFEEAGLRGGYLDENLTIYRYNEKSITRAKNVDGLCEHVKVARKHAGILGWKNKKVKQSYGEFLWHVADIYYSHRCYRKAAARILESIRYNPIFLLKGVRRIIPIGKRKKIETNRINILYYDPTSGFGGSSRCLVSWLKKLDRGKYNPIVVVHFNGPAMERIRSMQIPVIRLPFRSIIDYQYAHFRDISRIISYSLLLGNVFVYDLPTALLLARIIGKYHVNVMHLNSKVCSVIPGIMASRMTKVPCICHLHDIKTPVTKERIFAKWVNRFIVLTEKALELYRKEYPESMMELISNGVDLNDYRFAIDEKEIKKKYKIPVEDKVVGIVGRLVEGKGFSDFVKAAKIVLLKNPAVTFVIIGSDPMDGNEYEEYVRKLVKELSIEGKVIFTGWREDAVRIMSVFDILVQASSTFPEGFGMTVIEAMALKKPVIVTDIPGPSEIAIDNITGYIVPPSDPGKMAEAIEMILSNKELAVKMGENGLRRVTEHYNLVTIVRRFESLYASLAGESA